MEWWGVLTARNDAADSAQQEELGGSKLARVVGANGAGGGGSAVGLSERAREGALTSGLDQRREHDAGLSLCGEKANSINTKHAIQGCT